MNRDRLEQLARTIETLEPEDFDLSRFQHECGSPACIAGWAAWEADGRPAKSDQSPMIEERALDWLGVDGYRARRWLSAHLFQATTSRMDIQKAYVSPADAASAIRSLAATNRIKWPGERAKRYLRTTTTPMPREGD